MKLDRRSKIPFYRQIYDRFREAISSGQLAPGARLPSARSLASQLGTARGTVDVAYSMLAGEGYVVGQGAAGTTVVGGLGVQSRGAEKRPSAVTQTSDTSPQQRPKDYVSVAIEKQHEPRPFQMGLPAFDVFPRKLWSRLAMRRARNLAVTMLGYSDALGEPSLRDAIASYLAIARGIHCSPDQVVITSGYQGALGLISRVLLTPGDAVWLEDPGYFLSRLGFQAAGAKIVPVPVDDEGLEVDTALRRNVAARLAVVTPSHQAPLGMSLSLHRRLALLDWAQQRQAWIIEDDYDSEYRYAGRPLPALKSLDQADRVLYVGTFSKVLFPGLRLGYLVLPDTLIERFTQVCRLLHPGQTAFSQLVVADFMTEGHFARHIRRMRQLYAERRAALAAALSDQMSDRFHIHLAAGGLHLLIRPKKRESDRVLARRAAAYDLAPAPLSSFRIERDCGQGLMLNFTNIPAENAPKIVRRLGKALNEG